MRIAILSNTMDESGGGAGRIAALGAQGLRERGHEIQTWGPKSWFIERDSLSIIARLIQHLKDLSTWKKTVTEIQTWKPDILLTHNLTGCGFGTAKAIQAANIRWAHIIHDVQLIEPSGQIQFKEKKSFFRFVWRRFWSDSRKVIFGSPDIVLSPTRWLADFYASWNWFQESEVRIIHNPAPDIPFSTAHQPGTVLFVGRLESDKGFDTLLQAWSKIIAPEAKLICIGQGSLRQQGEQLSDSRIQFLGQQPSEQVLKEMAQASIVVVPSKILENQPTVILEALASGCDVVASNLGGIPETLDGQGYLFSAGNADELATMLNDMLKAEKKPINQKSVPTHTLANYLDQLEAALIEKR